jgi:hypothetical protein
MRPRYEEREEREREEEYRPRHVHRPPDGGSRRDHVVISTVIIGVILFLVIGTPYLKHHLPPDGSLVNSIGGDADREAVRHWLRDNADDPEFRETHWWPARRLSANDDRREAYDDRRDGDRRESDRPNYDKRDDDRSGDRVCRMQYRERTASGEDVNRDDYFVIRDGRARILSRNSSLAVAARRTFADSDGLP